MPARLMNAVDSGRIATRLAGRLTPPVLSAATFCAGVVLLFSGATPAGEGRLEWLRTVLPLPVIEISHFLGSVAGATLLVLSQGLARRLDAAYFFASATIAIGMMTSLLKGGGYEEAVLLAPVLFVLWEGRSAFDRRAAFFDTKFSPAWMAAVAGALGASVWLG